MVAVSVYGADLMDVFSPEMLEEYEGTVPKDVVTSALNNIQMSYGDLKKIRKAEMERNYINMMSGRMKQDSHSLMNSTALGSRKMSLVQARMLAKEPGRRRSTIVEAPRMPKPKKPEYDDDMMDEFGRLEDGIQAVAQSDDDLMLLWGDIDLNHNGDVDLNEMSTYMTVRYPVLGNVTPMTLAFTRSITGDGAVKTVDMVLKKHMLRKFLIRLFYFSKLWCAFKRMDTHRDMEVEENEFAAGFTRFKSDLGIDDEEMDAQETFDEIAKTKFMTYSDLCDWYLGTVSLNLEDSDWYPPIAVAVVPLEVDLPIFVDMLLHCHYVTRA